MQIILFAALILLAFAAVQCLQADSLSQLKPLTEYGQQHCRLDLDGFQTSFQTSAINNEELHIIYFWNDDCTTGMKSEPVPSRGVGTRSIEEAATSAATVATVAMPHSDLRKAMPGRCQQSLSSDALEEVPRIRWV